MIMAYKQQQQQQQGKKRRLHVDEEADKWLKRYSPNDRILLVGEGDFSFSSSMARFIGFANNIVATSLDSYDELIKKYKQASVNLKILKELGAVIIHGVDATKMKFHSALVMKKFDRIIFNFPHAGFHGKEHDECIIVMHKNLVAGFFRNATSMLGVNGEIHVSHKTSPPFSLWHIEELASKNELLLKECIDFKIEDYPGYNQKRGQGDRCDEPFPLGESSAFKFGVSYSFWLRRAAIDFEFGRTEHQPTLLSSGNLQASFSFNNSLENRQSSWEIDVGNESAKFCHGFNHAWQIHEPSFNLVPYPIHESQNYNFKRYRMDAPERTMRGYHHTEHRFNNLTEHRQSSLAKFPYEFNHTLRTHDPSFNVTTYPVHEPQGYNFRRCEVEVLDVHGDHPPEHWRSSWATGVQRETARFTYGFNHALMREHDPIFSVGAYSQDYNFKSYSREAPERTMHGDYRMLHSTEPLSRIIRRESLQNMVLRYGQYPEPERRIRSGHY